MAKGLCWAGYWDYADGIWRCVLEDGHEGPHAYEKPAEFSEATKTLTIRNSNGDIVEIKPRPTSD